LAIVLTDKKHAKGMHNVDRFSFGKKGHNTYETKMHELLVIFGQERSNNRQLFLTSKKLPAISVRMQ